MKMTKNLFSKIATYSVGAVASTVLFAAPLYADSSIAKAPAAEEGEGEKSCGGEKDCSGEKGCSGEGGCGGEKGCGGEGGEEN
jgi:hypothetical protein